MLPVSDTEMERLTFIRQLYQLGVEHSYSPEPMNAVAILIFHDAVDLLLQVAADRHKPETKKKIIYLVDYIDDLNACGAGPIEGRQSMLRLNSARTGLKHHGIRPAVTEIDSLRSSVTDFFENNVPLLFGLKFDEISLARLVSLPEAREYLEKSETLLIAGEMEDAVQAIATAFAYLMRQQHVLEPAPHHRHGIRYAASMSGANVRVEQEVRELGDQMEGICRAVNALQERVMFLSLGIGPARMKDFTEIAPTVAIAFDGTPRVESVRYPRLSPLTIDDVRFCYEFVVGIALAIQRRW